MDARVAKPVPKTAATAVRNGQDGAVPEEVVAMASSGALTARASGVFAGEPPVGVLSAMASAVFGVRGNVPERGAWPPPVSFACTRRPAPKAFASS